MREENVMSPQEKKVLSYHTFIFPFIWNHNGTVTHKQFEKCMNPYWEQDFRKNSEENAKYDPRLYAQYCYFNQAARNLIFMETGDPNPIVRNFHFDLSKFCGQKEWLQSIKGETNPVRYVIKKDNFEAELRVNGIRLRLFSTGVGMIVFELENYDKNSEKDITLINEYGRRVFMPYVDDKGGCSLCADTITLKYPNGEIVSTFSGKDLEHNSDIRFMELILYLLRNDRYAATTALKPEVNQFRIEPIIDDRMFVACAWLNNDFALEMQKFAGKEKEYCYLADAFTMEPNAKNSAARRLYELLFIDGDGLSCRSRTMLHEMLSEHVYHRWLEYSPEYGTVSGITEYSLLTVSSDDIAVNAHLMDYTEMAMLVLAQRASLLAFERQISDCARGKLRVNRIQRAYVQFQSKYLLREVTPQQQGIEMYNMLIKNLFISDMQSDLENQINALFALERDASDRADNWILIVLAILGIVEVVDWCLGKPSCLSVLLSVAVGAVLLLLFLCNHRNRLKKTRYFSRNRWT